MCVDLFKKWTSEAGSLLLIESLNHFKGLRIRKLIPLFAFSSFHQRKARRWVEERNLKLSQKNQMEAEFGVEVWGVCWVEVFWRGRLIFQIRIFCSSSFLSFSFLFWQMPFSFFSLAFSWSSEFLLPCLLCMASWVMLHELCLLIFSCLSCLRCHWVYT